MICKIFSRFSQTSVFRLRLTSLGTCQHLYDGSGSPHIGSFAIDNLTLVTPVPEPGSLSQLGLGIGALIALHRKKFGIGL